MKFVYVLTSSEEDYYYEQFFQSAVSMRLYNPDAEVIALIDEKTKTGLIKKRCGYEKFISEIKVINVPDEYSQKESSRWIKTSIHHFVQGSFVFIDCDTVITAKLAFDFAEGIHIGAVLDTHITLENHHKLDDFRSEDIDAGFVSSLKTNLRFNGGLIYCSGSSSALDFFEKWHSLWIEGRKRGCSQDMPSLNQANYEMGNIITELSGEWNCQISHNGLRYLYNAKIIHYYATSLLNIAHPYKLASAEVLSSIRDTGEISQDIYKMLHYPLAAFEEGTRIISGKYILEIFDSLSFKLLLWIRDYHYNFYLKQNRIIGFFISLMKKNPSYSKRKLRDDRVISGPAERKRNGKKAIFIDCRMFAASGIGVYLKECLPLLLKSPNDFLLLGDPELLRNVLSAAKNVSVINCKIKPFSLHELLFFPRSILKQINASDIYYSPYFNIPFGIKIPIFTTIHDIIFPDMPEMVSRAGLAARMHFFRRAYRKSKKIFTVSEFSKSRIQHHLGSAKPVVVAHSGIQPMFLTYRNNAPNREKKETIVFIGNIKKHKGLDILLDAFLMAKKEGLPHKLLIIGDNKKFRTSDNAILKKIEPLGDDAASFSGFISDEQLMEYMSEASLLVQPSLYEGFGLPPLEAMVLGTPALVSEIPAFREIIGGFPVTFFGAGNAAELKDKIMEILYDKQAQVVNLPQELLYKYTFEKTTSIILRELAG